MDQSYSGKLPIHFPTDLLVTAFDLINMGVNELAWKYPTILDVIQYITDNGRALLGGDVYRVSERGLSPTGDSWFINKSTGVTNVELVKESRIRATDYVTSYHARNGDDFLYSVVIAD